MNELAKITLPRIKNSGVVLSIDVINQLWDNNANLSRIEMFDGTPLILSQYCDIFVNTPFSDMVIGRIKYICDDYVIAYMDKENMEKFISSKLDKYNIGVCLTCYTINNNGKPVYWENGFISHGNLRYIETNGGN